MTTLLERVAQFDATMLLLGGEPDEDSDLWDCNRQWDFPTMCVEVLWSDDGHYVRVDRYSHGAYVDSADIPVELSFDRAQEYIIELLEKANEQR